MCYINNTSSNPKSFYQLENVGIDYKLTAYIYLHYLCSKLVVMPQSIIICL